MQLAVADTGRDLRLRQEEVAAEPKLRDLCHREEGGSTDFYSGIIDFYDLSYYDEIRVKYILWGLQYTDMVELKKI